jgi:molybdate transport system substrate-binding protein
MSSVAIKGAYLELVPAFEKRSGNKVETHWVGMSDIARRMQAGDVVDAVIGSTALIKDLVEKGILEQRTALARSGVGAAVRAGARKPDISTVEALKRALLEARSIVYSSGPSGLYLAELFQRLGLADKLKDTARQMPPGMLVAEVVARGEAQLCFQQLPELRQVSGIDYIGPLPGEVQSITEFSGAVHRKAQAPEAAKAFLAFLASSENMPLLRQKGFDV